MVKHHVPNTDSEPDVSVQDSGTRSEVTDLEDPSDVSSLCGVSGPAEGPGASAAESA